MGFSNCMGNSNYFSFWFVIVIGLIFLLLLFNKSAADTARTKLKDGEKKHVYSLCSRALCT